MEPALREELLALYAKMASEGKLAPHDQLDRHLENFRQRFGPDVLAKLDGEELLRTMYLSGTHDSLAYWLEFKNDEEFRTVEFGSVAGGSALKYGTFYRQPTGTWMGRGPSHAPVEISFDQALEIARSHKSQLLRGTELLAGLPDDSTDETYRRLQERMDKEAPDVSDLAWGHK